MVVAHDGPSGLAKAREIAPIAILLDVMLPGLDGWRVLRELRADPKTARIPVIVETVLDERHFAYALGAAGYLRKPISREDLTAAVGEIAARADAGHALVVDDDREAVDRVAQMLERDGWTVSRAHDGAEALAEMERAKPSLVLVDLLMPKMDGYAFIRRVRENRAWDDVALVVLTADDIANARIRSIAAETSGVVQKGDDAAVGSGARSSQIRAQWQTRRCVGETRARAARNRRLNMARILLVEDNEQIWDFLSRRLQRRGHEVLLAQDGEEGVASAKSGSPDVILLDMNLPVLDGWTAAGVLKADPHTQGIPIIALTAHAMAGDKEKAIQAGADVYHPKPIELEQAVRADRRAGRRPAREVGRRNGRHHQPATARRDGLVQRLRGRRDRARPRPHALAGSGSADSARSVAAAEFCPVAGRNGAPARRRRARRWGRRRGVHLARADRGDRLSDAHAGHAACRRPAEVPDHAARKDSRSSARLCRAAARSRALAR